MQPSSIDGVLLEAEAAITPGQLRDCLVDALSIVMQLNAEINDLRNRKPAIASALSAFQKAHKDRTARR